MALFGKGNKSKEAKRPAETTRSLTGRKAYCRVCDSHQLFSRCWLRIGYVAQCPCCGLVFDDPPFLYKRFQPTCPRCHEFLEQPNFEYGTCDGCGSKYELMPGTRPGLLPNKAQRQEMDKHGKIWRME